MDGNLSNPLTAELFFIWKRLSKMAISDFKIYHFSLPLRLILTKFGYNRKHIHEICFCLILRKPLRKLKFHYYMITITRSLHEDQYIVWNISRSVTCFASLSLPSISTIFSQLCLASYLWRNLIYHNKYARTILYINILLVF